MKNLLFLILITISLIPISANAKDSHTTKPERQEFKSNEDFFQKIAALEQRQKEAKAKTEAARKRSEEIRQLGKVVDEVAKELGIEE